MSRLVRPLIFVAVISFMLGLWLSLRRAETHLLSQLQEPDPIVILTDEPEWWQPVARKARFEGVADLKFLVLPRRRWNEVLGANSPRCTFVTTSSYFVPQFLSHKWLDSNSGWLDPVRDQIHPDFRNLQGEASEHILPLLWGVPSWQTDSSTDQSGKLAVQTSLDDALLVALDLHPGETDMLDPESTDPMELVRQIWARTEGEVSLNLSQSDYSVPVSPVKARQVYANRKGALTLQSDEHLPNNGQSNLWYYALGACPNQKEQKTAVVFLNWLLKPENVTLLAESSQLALTASSADNEKVPETLRPSFLRRLPLGLLKSREVPWELAAAWFDFWLSPQDAAASR